MLISVLIAAEKCGVGKSTIARDLAVHLAYHSIDVVLVDTNGQAIRARFVERRDGVKRNPNLIQRRYPFIRSTFPLVFVRHRSRLPEIITTRSTYHRRREPARRRPAEAASNR
ncbi:division plane positioning ATPase MipZ [Paraburkholderia denitrificans]|uniref:Division plane positioning ATPase MipZ n=1 Tax=Paraburkholderia denitrificans TaxID=694025 RepID=A0ABW0J454_9BURK